jgi:hypothetical protein
MKSWKGLTTVLVFLLIVILSACQGIADEPAVLAPGVAPMGDGAVAPARNAAPLSPEAATEAFFTWYVENTRAIMDGERDAPASGILSDESDALTPELKAELAANSNGPADPVLFAQDLPGRIEVERWQMAGDTACVIVHKLWEGSPPSDLTVDLVRSGETWLVDDISAGTPATPDGVTRLFYSWYLAEARDDTGMLRNLVAEGAYRTSRYLTPGFIAYVDELAAAGNLAYDPILLAQDIPMGISVGQPVVDGPTATVVVERYYEGNPEPSAITVQLEHAAVWQIAGVFQDGESPAQTPQEVVDAFYADWRLAYIGDMRVSEESPLHHRAYRDSPFLTAEFIARVDELVAAGEPERDPFFCAAEVPAVIAVETVEMSGPAANLVVTTDVGAGSLIVVLRLTGAAAWLVDDVICPPAAVPAGPAVSQETDALQVPMDVSGWESVVDEEHGVTLAVPPGWVLRPMDMTLMPDDWPVVAGYFLMPESVAEAMAAQSGPPDPDAPPVVPPLTVEFLVGGQAAFDRVYVPMASSEEIEINGRPVLVERDRGDYALVRYSVVNPADPGLRIVITDGVSAFVGREEAANELAGVLPGILQNLTFTP